MSDNKKAVRQDTRAASKTAFNGAHPTKFNSLLDWHSLAAHFDLPDLAALPMVGGCHAYPGAVTKAMRAKFPDLPLILCAYDDTGTEGNPGLTKATEAARVAGGLFATPYQADTK